MFDSVYGLIHGLSSYDHEAIAEGLYALKRVCEPIYTVNIMYNDFKILQDVFLMWKLWVFLHLYVEFGSIYKLP